MGNVLIAIIVLAVIVFVYFAVGFLGRFIEKLMVMLKKIF